MYFFPAILVAIEIVTKGKKEQFQIVDEVSSEDDMRDKIINYVQNGPSLQLVIPDKWELHSRDENGYYTIIQSVES